MCVNLKCTVGKLNNYMTIQEVLNYFGNQNKLAISLGVSRSAVGKWVKDNEIPPKRQIEIQRLTNSKIKVK